MELKIKYQYTYFIKPFIIKESKYEKYLLSLLSNSNYKLRIFEKERDLNLYTYFIQNTREYFFPSFLFDSEKISQLKDMKCAEKAKFLSKFHCNIFEYNLNEKPQGKIDETDGIYFNIDKIKIMCLDSGICFLIIKTNMENSDNFSDLLNFNYKFKDINTEYGRLKEYNNIKIQTDSFGNMTELSNFIDGIVGVNTDAQSLNDIDLYNKRFFVYSYACINQEMWNSKEDYKKIENEFIRYLNVVSNNRTLNFNEEDFENNYGEYSGFKYSKFGFAKQSACLFCSSVDINNYTKVLFDFENEYLYTLLISLYQRIYLKRLEKDLKDKKNMDNIIKRFYKFSEEIWNHEITNSATGTMYYNKWKDIFELKDLYKQVKNRFEIAYRGLNIDNNSKTNKVVSIALIISLILNVINFIAMAKLL